jgi:hypothetical protein
MIQGEFMRTFKRLVISRTRSLAVSVVCGLLAGCASHPALLTGSQPPHVTKVAVAKPAQLGSVNMPEDLRVKILQRASAFATSGAPKTLDVQITNVNFKNPLAALLVGDSNRVTVVVRVIDGFTGKVDATYESVSLDSQYVNGVAGAVMSAADNPIDIEQRLTDAAAKTVLAKLYGTEAAQQVANKPLDRKVTAQYPRSYEDLKTEARCKATLEANVTSETNKHDAFHGKTGPLPPECSAVGVVAKPAVKKAAG